jgi:hypothetical protein
VFRDSVQFPAHCVALLEGLGFRVYNPGFTHFHLGFGVWVWGLGFTLEAPGFGFKGNVDWV